MLHNLEIDYISMVEDLVMVSVYCYVFPLSNPGFILPIECHFLVLEFATKYVRLNFAFFGRKQELEVILTC